MYRILFDSLLFQSTCWMISHMPNSPKGRSSVWKLDLSDRVSLPIAESKTWISIWFGWHLCMALLAHRRAIHQLCSRRLTTAHRVIDASENSRRLNVEPAEYTADIYFRLGSLFAMYVSNSAQKIINNRIFCLFIYFYLDDQKNTLTFRRLISSSEPKSSRMGLHPCGYTISDIFDASEFYSDSY